MSTADQHARRIADFLLEEDTRISRLPKERRQNPTPSDTYALQDAQRRLDAMLRDYESAVTSELIASLPD